MGAGTERAIKWWYLYIAFLQLPNAHICLAFILFSIAVEMANNDDDCKDDI